MWMQRAAPYTKIVVLLHIYNVYIHIYTSIYICMYVYAYTSTYMLINVCMTCLFKSENAYIHLISIYAIPYMSLLAPWGPGSGPPPPITRHRLGHQSGLDESSGRNSATFLHGIVFPVYLVFSKINISIEYDKNVWAKIWLSWKMHVSVQAKKEALVASLKRRKWGLGLPIHIEILLVLIFFD